MKIYAPERVVAAPHDASLIRTLLHTNEVPPLRPAKGVLLHKATQTDPVATPIIKPLAIELQAEKQQVQAIKVDALWKPIIRKFRQHIKNLLLHNRPLQAAVNEKKH